ncbi:acyl-CoA thioesterase domain-containing protein [Nocardia sp. NPDC058499]|uniref:acyl-CoA thioesterase domain-containing protein n=1 Tax=Nocardia sp. NPDC058499 TaxID=3346530 RepID=UPI003667B266
MATITTATPLGDLNLDEQSETQFSAYLPESFCFDGRGFGGYTAALAAAAGSRWSSGRQLNSIHALFPNVAVPGDLELKVQPLVQGRSADACQVRVDQDGKTVVLASCWFVEANLIGDPEVSEGDASARPRPGSSEPAPSPESCPEIPWIAEVAPFLKGFHARSVDYPVTLEEFEAGFRDGGNSISLWAVPDETYSDPMAGRLSDIMFLDAHLVDAVLRDEQPDTAVVTLDLSATWTRLANPPVATLLHANAGTRGQLATIEAALIDRNGEPRATATSQGRIYRPRG